MLNSRVLRKLLVTFSALLCSGFFFGLYLLRALAAESSYAPPPFACEVRYHFREHFRHAKPGDFPQVMPNPLIKTGDSSRKEFELPVEQDLKKKIKKMLLAQDQFLTHVDLIVGMDDDFLSADFPK